MGRKVALEPEVRAARAIKRALAGLDVEQRSKALDLALGPRETTDRLPRYKMALEAAQVVCPKGNAAWVIIDVALDDGKTAP